MKLTVLVTGKNRRIASDICEHLNDDRDCNVIKCPSTKSALLETSLNELPNVVIICAGDETKDTIKVFDVLRESVRVGAVEIIIVANDEDRKSFMGMSKLKKMFFLSRPVSLSALYKKLDEIEEYMDEYEKKHPSLTEYINENGVEEFPKKHILVVDDDPEQLIVIKDHLKEFYEVSVLNGGKHIFKFLARYKVDLILLDYVMPDIDGPEVLKSLRKSPEHKDIPVVFLTGVSEKEVVVKTLTQLKPQGYVLKPSKKSEIVAKIIDVLG